MTSTTHRVGVTPRLFVTIPQAQFLVRMASLDIRIPFATTVLMAIAPLIGGGMAQVMGGGV